MSHGEGPGETDMHLEEGFHRLGVSSCHDDFTSMNVIQGLSGDIGGSGVAWGRGQVT